MPTYTKPRYTSFSLGGSSKVTMDAIVEFLTSTVNDEHLDIAEYLDQMNDKSFLLVAATGLGKTVAVPVHVLIRQIQKNGVAANPLPRVWVVEPRIPIAIEQAEYMNYLWTQFMSIRGTSRTKLKPLFGCVTSASGRVNRDAPIQFVTTGIFELMAREGSFDSVQDRIIIDEAHVTVEQNPGVELGIGLCRRDGVIVDYMSATVDVTGLQEALGVSVIIRADQVRNIIWKSNLRGPLDETIVDLVRGTLINPRKSSKYYPKSNFNKHREVVTSVLEPGRSHGMLIIVNSFNGDMSDTRKVTQKLAKAFEHLPVLHLAGDVVRDPKLQSTFKRRLDEIERASGNYVIIATSVVEMGITFPTLDYVVTMDSGYNQETVGDISFPVVSPLGANSLLQRIGRVGRKRPGIAYISKEIGADYSDYNDQRLNSVALTYEPIRYPLSTAPLTSLAYFVYQSDMTDPEEDLTHLELPSKIHADKRRIDDLYKEIDRFDAIGMIDDESDLLNELGVLMRDWIGRTDISYAAHLQKRFADGASYEEVIFWIVATAMSNTSASSLKIRGAHFIDTNNSEDTTSYRVNVWLPSLHEDIAVFGVIAKASDDLRRFLWNKDDRTQLGFESFSRWCNWTGLNPKRVLKAFQTIQDTFNLFSKINGKSERFIDMFSGANVFEPKFIDWFDIQLELNEISLTQQLNNLYGVQDITVGLNSDFKLVWTTEKIAATKISQDITPVILDITRSYRCRVVPSRFIQGDSLSWNVMSFGLVPVVEVTAPVVRARAPRKECLLRKILRFFGF